MWTRNGRAAGHLTFSSPAANRHGIQDIPVPRQHDPRIDGQTDDWAMVPDSYAYGTDQLSDTVMGNFTNYDREDLDVTVRVGWVKGLNRLYFLYEAYDDYWNMYYKYGDLFEIAIDADRSGGPNLPTPRSTTSGKATSCSRRARPELPHLHTCRGRTGLGVRLGVPAVDRQVAVRQSRVLVRFRGKGERQARAGVLDHAFDYAPYDGPERAAVSKLEENSLIALSWAVLDFDEDHTEYEGFWNLSHETRMDNNASNLCAFR